MGLRPRRAAPDELELLDVERRSSPPTTAPRAGWVAVDHEPSARNAGAHLPPGSRGPPGVDQLEAGAKELDAPTHADIAEVAARTAARIEKIPRAHGRSLDPELDDGSPPDLARDEPGLAACYAAAAQGLSVSGDRAGKPPLRLTAWPEPPPRPRAADASDQPIAEVRGINLHAAR
ncbi:MAG: hypothetical protein IT376_03690, partial [Polyangiaceae bacterium]|nr:hypothetical protein [Polyangiaceae bacterium]